MAIYTCGFQFFSPHGMLASHYNVKGTLSFLTMDVAHRSATYPNALLINGHSPSPVVHLQNIRGVLVENS